MKTKEIKNNALNIQAHLSSYQNSNLSRCPLSIACVATSKIVHYTTALRIKGNATKICVCRAASKGVCTFPSTYPAFMGAFMGKTGWKRFNHQVHHICDNREKFPAAR